MSGFLLKVTVHKVGKSILERNSLSVTICRSCQRNENTKSGTAEQSKSRTRTKAQKTSRNSSKPPSSDITKPPSSAPATTADGKRKQGGQPGHEKHTRTEFTPDQIDHVQRIPLGGCPCCGGNLAELDTPPETFHQVEVAAKPVVVTEYQRGSGWCEHCQTSVKPDWPPGLVEAGLTGPGLIALIGFLKGGCSMSIGTIKRYLRDCMQLHLSEGYIAKLLNRISGCLAEPYAELERLLPNEPLVNVDETGHKDNGSRFWTWVFRAEMFTFFHRHDEYATEAGYRNALCRVRHELVYKAAMEAPQTQDAMNLSERFFQHTESYFLFITEPAIDPTNNVAKQAFRFVAIQRRITQGTRGRAGQLWSERIWTVFATCGQQGRSAYEYLVSSITAHCRHQPIPSLIWAGTNSS
jgi:hypothetical protein